MNRLSFPLLRWLNGALGLAFLAQAVHSSDGITFALASLFGAKAILNRGCCSTGPCILPDHTTERRSMSGTADQRTNQP